MSVIELLSPAKNIQIGKAAIDCGADAVYIGAKSFGARAAVGNSIEELEELAQYAHIFNAKVYVTINTLLFDDELQEAEDLIHQLYNIGIDAIIIQDFGILEMDLPPMQIHASTQMHNFSVEKVEFLNKIGISRVVLARELSLEQISEIHNSIPDIEIESFIHGALCCGLSGQCYMSQALAKRSGNRGVCAQPCRSRYDLLNSKGEILLKDKHLLSTKDFNASEYIPQMIEAGVMSFKIEGRLKDIDYVKNVTSYYNQEINKYISQSNGKYKRASVGRVELDFEPNLNKSFNRGFTSFYLDKRKDKVGNIDTAKALGEYLGEVRKVDSQSFVLDKKARISNGDGLCYFNTKGELDGFLVNNVNYSNIVPNKRLDMEVGTKVYRNLDIEFNRLIQRDDISSRKIGVFAELEETEKGLLLRFTDEEGLSVETLIETEKQLAKNLDNYDEKLYSQIEKLGNTCFYLKGFNNKCTQKYFFPSSVINNLRRDCSDKLLELRKENYEPEEQLFEKTDYTYPQSELDYRANIINNKAKDFYLRHGVKSFEWGVEKNNDTDDIVLMTSRHCLRYQIGQCLKRDKVSKEYQGDLILQDNKRRYKLVFDCENCLMSIL